MWLRFITIVFIVGQKCTLAALHAAPGWDIVSVPTGQTDGQTDGRQTVTLRFPLDAASVINDMD